MAKTSEVAEGFFGEKLYQQRARLILPILVRQAAAEERISYESLAQELGMTNARVLNYPLGCVGWTLIDLAKTWKKRFPTSRFSLLISKPGSLGLVLTGF